MLTTSSTTLFFFLITIFTFPSIPESIVQVKYSRDPLRRTENQPLTLKCTAEYEETQCGNIWVSWYRKDLIEYKPLTDPDRYSLRVNETKIRGKRQRDAFITFTPLTLRDTGLYQCKAICQHTRTSAMGHVINVTVIGDANKGEKILNRSNQCNVPIILLTISVFILL